MGSVSATVSADRSGMTCGVGGVTAMTAVGGMGSTRGVNRTAVGGVCAPAAVPSSTTAAMAVPAS